MVKKRAAIYAAACFITLVLAAPFILGPALNSRYIKFHIAKFIEKKTGAVLTPDQMVFTVFPQPGIRLQTADLPLTPAMGIHTNALHIQLDMGQILRGRIMISKIILEDMNIWFTPVAQDTQTFFTDAFSFQFPQDQVNQLFALFSDNQKNIELVLKNKKTRFFESLTGTLRISKSDQTLAFNCKIGGLHIEKTFFPSNFPYEKFPLNALASPGAHLYIQLNPRSGFTGSLAMEQFLITSDQLPDKTITGSNLLSDFGFSRDLLFFDLAPVHLDYPDAVVSMTFSDDRSRQKTALTFSGKNIDIAQAREATLAIAPENRVVSQLFDILRQGTASDISVAFHGPSAKSLFDGKKMVLEGSAENAVVNIPQTALRAEDVEGSARVTQGVLEIDARKARIKDTHIRQGTLAIDLMNHQDIPFNAEFALDVDLSQVPGILISLLPHTLLARELAHVHQVQGRVDTRLGLGMKTGQKQMSVFVSADPFSGTGYYDRIPFPITISQGLFQYSGSQVVLTDFSGQIGTNPFTGLTTRVNLEQNALVSLSARSFGLNIGDILSWKQLLPEIKNRLGPVQHVQGQLTFDHITFKGPAFEPDQWTWELTGSGRDIQAGFTPSTREIKQMTGAFKISEKSVSAENIKAVFSDLNWLSPVLGSGLAASITLPLFLEEAKIHITGTSASVDGYLKLDKKIQFSMKMTGKNRRELKPGMVMLKHGAMTDAILMFDWHSDPPRVRFEGKLHADTLLAMVTENSLLGKRITALTGGAPMKIFTDNHSQVHVDTPQLYLEPLAPPPPPGPDTPLFLLVPAQKNIRLKADRMVYRNYTFSDLKAGIVYDGHVSRIQLDSADLCGLKISGHRERQTAPDPTFHITIQAAEKQDIQPVLSCLFPDLDLMDGKYSFVADLNGKGSMQAFKNNVNGDISFTSHNGRIHKMTLLSRLLSVLNILKLPNITQQGFKYRSILVDAQVKKGVIHLEKAVVDAENMALFFSGQVFPFENKLNLTCLVAPFKTIDTIIKYIPMVNTILSGPLVSFPAKATGAIHDPVITPLHPSAVGEGIMNMFINIIKTPARLFEEIP